MPVGVTVRLDSEMARAALLVVPRLQRKHYELIPKQLDEMSFWVNFFSHMTVMVGPKHAEFLEAQTASGKYAVRPARRHRPVRPPAREESLTRVAARIRTLEQPLPLLRTQLVRRLIDMASPRVNGTDAAALCGRRGRPRGAT